VLKNYGNQRGGDPASGGNAADGMLAHDTHVGVTDFGSDDLIYLDSQFNSVISGDSERYDPLYTEMGDGASGGGVAGDTMIIFGLDAAQQGSQAYLVLSGISTSEQYAYTSLSDLMLGLGGTSSPVIQG
jgi:hypothetical protein